MQEGRGTLFLEWCFLGREAVATIVGFAVFEDGVTDKNYSYKIEMVRLQYRGNAHGLIQGIGVVNFLFVNPKTQCFWIIDWRVFDLENDAKS